MSITVVTLPLCQIKETIIYSIFLLRVLASDLEELIVWYPGRSIGSLAQEMGIYETAVRKMVSEDLSYKSYTVKIGQFKQEDAGQAQEEPLGGVGEGGLASHLTRLQPFRWCCVGVSDLRVKAKPHNKTEDLIQNIKEVRWRGPSTGTPSRKHWSGTHGGWCHYWRPFCWINLFTMCSSAIFILF